MLTGPPPKFHGTRDNLPQPPHLKASCCTSNLFSCGKPPALTMATSSPTFPQVTPGAGQEPRPTCRAAQPSRELGHDAQVSRTSVSSVTVLPSVRASVAAAGVAAAGPRSGDTTSPRRGCSPRSGVRPGGRSAGTSRCRPRGRVGVVATVTAAARRQPLAYVARADTGAASSARRVVEAGHDASQPSG